jgi:hypothetical protein
MARTAHHSAAPSTVALRQVVDLLSAMISLLDHRWTVETVAVLSI